MGARERKGFIAWCKETVSTRRARWLSAGAGVLFLGLVMSYFVVAARNGNDAGRVVVDYSAVVQVMRPTPHPFSPVADAYYEEYAPVYTGPVAMLTGLPLDEAYRYRRPIAVVVNNLFAALPQSGLSYADVIYEVLAEGNITRLIAIFQSQMPEVVGPVRSTRNYFAPMAMNHDAFLVHHGGSDAGYARIRELGTEALDGMRLANVFWRDRTFPAWAGRTGQRGVEHSSFTGWPQIYTHITARDMRYYVQTADTGFAFGGVPANITPLGTAERVYVPFSREYERRFVFRPYYNDYLVYNPRGPHVDALTDGGQLTVRNVLVQLTTMRVIDNEGRRNVDLVGYGRGYLFTMGQQFAVRWEKSALDTPMRWQFECGTPLQLPAGTTWICVLQAGAVVLTS